MEYVISFIHSIESLYNELFVLTSSFPSFSHKTKKWRRWIPFNLKSNKKKLKVWSFAALQFHWRYSFKQLFTQQTKGIFTRRAGKKNSLYFCNEHKGKNAKTEKLSILTTLKYDISIYNRNVSAFLAFSLKTHKQRIILSYNPDLFLKPLPVSFWVWCIL